MDGIYEISFETPLGTKKGTVKLVTSGNSLDIEVNAPLAGKQRAKGEVEGSSFNARGRLSSLVLGKTDYTVEGKVEGDCIEATIHAKSGEISVAGRRK